MTSGQTPTWSQVYFSGRWIMLHHGVWPLGRQGSTPGEYVGTSSKSYTRLVKAKRMWNDNWRGSKKPHRMWRERGKCQKWLLDCFLSGHSVNDRKTDWKRNWKSECTILSKGIKLIIFKHLSKKAQLQMASLVKSIKCLRNIQILPKDRKGCTFQISYDDHVLPQNQN